MEALIGFGYPIVDSGEEAFVRTKWVHWHVGKVQQWNAGQCQLRTQMKKKEYVEKKKI